MESKYTIKEVSRNQQILGDLYLSNYKFVFRPNGTKPGDCLKYSVPYGYILKLQESSNSDKTNCLITVTCKDERVFKFKFEGNGPIFVQTLKVIRRYALQPKLENLYCYSWQSADNVGWSVVRQEAQRDFDRLKISQKFRAIQSRQEWQMSKMPRVVYVHPQVTDQMLDKIMRVRREKRFPTICYLHKNQCGIYRSAEPEVSLNTQPCADDLKYLILLSEITLPNQPAKPAFLYVFSSRPSPENQPGLTKDYGFENP